MAIIDAFLARHDWLLFARQASARASQPLGKEIEEDANLRRQIAIGWPQHPPGAR